MHRFIVLSALLVIATGCASSTVIRSNPPGATVRSHTGAVLGKTPYVHEDTQTVGHRETFELQMEGYQKTRVTASRNDWNTGRMLGFGIGGLFFPPVWAGLLWAQDYEPEYVVDLEAAQPAVPMMPAPAPTATQPSPAAPLVPAAAAPPASAPSAPPMPL